MVTQDNFEYIESSPCVNAGIATYKKVVGKTFKPLKTRTYIRKLDTHLGQEP